jgi:hypothetical protein
MVEWILLVHLTLISPEFEIWGGYHNHINCLAAQDRLHARYQQKKQQIRTRCQPVMAVQVEPRK